MNQNSAFSWIEEFLGSVIAEKSLLFFFTLFGGFYGGAHLLAWNAPFPDGSTRAFWQLYGLLIASGFPVMIFTIIFSKVEAYMTKTVRNMWTMSNSTREHLVSTTAAPSCNATKKVFNILSMIFFKIPLLIWAVLTGLLILSLGSYFLIALPGRLFLFIWSFASLSWLPKEAYKEPD